MTNSVLANSYFEEMGRMEDPHVDILKSPRGK